MDHGSFDRIARLLGSAGSRRAAIGALLGTGLAGAIAGAEAAKKDRNKKRRNGKKGRGNAQVSAQAADCLSPGHGSNISNCNYTNGDFSGQDLSSSRMVGTIFRNADLVETDLSSSNAKDANFRGADLCGADLSSSQLRNADFRGFNPAMGGRVTNLTNADLHSSGCAGILTNQFTIFCNTIGCDGEVINPGCSGQCGPPPPTICDEPFTSTSCDCQTAWVGGAPVCAQTLGVCSRPTCSSDAQCTGGATCIRATCCTGVGHCALPCPFLDDCDCPADPGPCLSEVKCGETTASARRTNGANVGSAEKQGAR